MATDVISVQQRLSAVPAILRVPSELMEIFVLRDFLAEKDCEHLIAMIDAKRKPSPLLSDNPNLGFRTSETCTFDRKDETVRRIEDRISSLVGIDPAYGEFAQGQRYETGQQFKAHHDYLREDQPYWDRQRMIGGQRTWTVMVFLNAPEQGGETYFPRLDLTITPRQGSLVAWNNLDRRGAPNPATLHQGRLVTSGRKYIITKWYRQRPWGLATA